MARRSTAHVTTPSMGVLRIRDQTPHSGPPRATQLDLWRASATGRSCGPWRPAVWGLVPDPLSTALSFDNHLDDLGTRAHTHTQRILAPGPEAPFRNAPSFAEAWAQNLCASVDHCDSTSMVVGEVGRRSPKVEQCVPTLALFRAASGKFGRLCGDYDQFRAN